MKCKQHPLLNLLKLAVVWSWVGPIRWLYIWHLEGIFHWAKWADKKLVCKQRLRAFAIQKCGSVLSSALVYLVLRWTGSNNFIRPHTTRLLRAPLTNLPLHNISLLLTPPPHKYTNTNTQIHNYRPAPLTNLPLHNIVSLLLLLTFIQGLT